MASPKSGAWNLVWLNLLHLHYNNSYALRILENKGFQIWTEGWYAPPIDRITNVSLAPGHGSLDDLLADTEDGAIYADTVKSWSIDQERRNFQFTCEIAWEIRGGRRARLLRLPTYQGSSVPFWRSCDAVTGESEWELHGIVNCGKGNPMQIAEMSHGAAPARFRKVRMLGVRPGN